MKSYIIRWTNGVECQMSERIACEDFEDAVSRCRMKAILDNGKPYDVECFGDITVLETAEMERAYDE